MTDPFKAAREQRHEKLSQAAKELEDNLKTLKRDDLVVSVTRTGLQVSVRHDLRDQLPLYHK
jgi:cell division protein FtsB